MDGHAPQADKAAIAGAGHDREWQNLSPARELAMRVLNLDFFMRISHISRGWAYNPLCEAR
jgi:hypothetical protein